MSNNNKLVMRTGGAIRDYYKAIPSKYKQPKVDYPGRDKVNIDLPCRVAIIGKSGAGKNQALLHLIENIPAWGEFYLCLANPDQPLWSYFIDQLMKVQKKIKKQILWVCDSPSKMPPIDEMVHDGVQKLWVYDDQLLKNKHEQAEMAKPFVYGRNLGISAIVLSQSWFGINRIVRLQADYILINKLNSNRDIKQIISDASLDVNLDNLMKMYEVATESVQNFLLIDKNTMDDSLKFRINLGDQ
ncbi:MAG: hypothetical protein JWL77_6950 [Chthonomonadaceae bacterium]|nr:hypothetical protein [Chthonomonadaceae bacterium]